MSESDCIKKYLTEFVLRFPNIETEMRESRYFIKNELEMLRREKISDNSTELTSIALQADWVVPADTKLQKIRLGDVQRRLIASTTTKQIRKMLVELAKFNLQQPLWSINRNWSLPNEIRVVVLNLKRGFLQDFSGCLLGKAYEMIQKKDFNSASTLLTDLRNELKRTDFASDQIVQKLGKILDWEKINVQIMIKLESAWPKKPPTIKDPLIVKINQMIRTMTNDMPRLEIIENVLLIMLNVNDWEACTAFDPKRSLTIELCSAFARTMIDVQHDMKTKNQLPRKREIWDLLLPIFNMSNQQQQAPNHKRNQHNRRSSDSPARFSMGTMNVSTLKQFLDKMRDPFVISILLSMFAKMHNLLKDDTNMELFIENMYLWPLSISNVNGYNIRTVSESLLQLLKLGLKFYPTNVGWIRLQGDLEYVNGNNEAAMKYYVQTLIVSTEHCSLPIQRPNIDESVIKKMIKCSSNLGCYLQAAVLCQFMEDIDYTLAFKCLQEKSGNFMDAMDSYFSLIWDNTLLEYIIHLHAKKGEHKRKLQAISYIRQLELNANNSEEVKHRAAAIRKVKFLRALANQFL
jgi:integrator complex subunit 8